MTQEYKVITNPYNPLRGMSYEEVKEAVMKDWPTIQYVKDQTEELCKLAVQKDKNALLYVKDEFISLFQE